MRAKKLSFGAGAWTIIDSRAVASATGFSVSAGGATAVRAIARTCAASRLDSELSEQLASGIGRALKDRPITAITSAPTARDVPSA
jgi:hypothetical protein